MKALILAMAVMTAASAHAKVACVFETSGYVNGVPTLTSNPLRVFADTDRVTSLFIHDGDFFADYSRVDELGVETISITYKTATNLHVEATAGFDKKGVARLAMAGNSKDRPNAKLTCKKN